MRLVDAIMAGHDQRLSHCRQTPVREPNFDYPLTGRTLYHVGVCPALWRRLGPEVDQNTSLVSEALWTMLLIPKRVAACLAVRPEKHQRLGMVCPKCGKAADSMRCTKCQVDREEKLLDVGWSRAIPACRAWEDMAEAHDRRVISQAEYQKIEAALNALLEPPEVREALESGERAVRVDGTLKEDDGTRIKVSAPVAIVPDEGSAYGDSIYLLHHGALLGVPNIPALIYGRGYHVRAALALDLVNQATGGVRRKVRLLIANMAEGHEPAYAELTKEMIEAGRAAYQRGAATYARAVKEKVWPGHDHDGRGGVAWRSIGVEAWMSVK